jgi:hypothetical protein
MPSPADDYVIGLLWAESYFFGGLHRRSSSSQRKSLTYAEGSEQLVQHSLIINSSHDFAKGVKGLPTAGGG